MGDSVEQRAPLRGICLRRQAIEVDASVDWHRRVLDAIAVSVGAVAGRFAARTIETDGVEMLHTVIGARDVARLREHVVETLRHDLLRLAVRAGRTVLRWRDELYVDDYLILRVNFPYDVARNADPAAENPGIGRVSPEMRHLAAARRVIDPVFDPKGYHRNHPPAAWAHGPHRDSWTGHSRDGINIWWAISSVPAEAGMVLYPELDDVELSSDPRSGYLRAGCQLPKPTSVALTAGEMLIFDPEVLHGTHLNITDKTRVALSMRLNTHQPRFDPACFYAREFWRRATAIEAGAFDEVLHLKREENLAPPAPPLPIPLTPRPPAIVVATSPHTGPTVIGLSTLVPDGHRIVVELAGSNVMIVRFGGVLRAFSSSCPHYGVDLSDGAIDDTAFYCPGCAVAFDLCSGRCRSGALTLRPLEVREEGGNILLDDAFCAVAPSHA
jgi:nitrite reductase/ring-hydroxylating ferredoxin subunit